MSLRIRNARAVSQGGARPGQYMGDPGIFGGIVGAAKGLVTGGVKGAIRGGISGLTGGLLGGTVEQRARMGQPTMGVPINMAPRGIGPGLSGVIRPTPGIAGTAQRLLPGGATGFEVMGCPSGYRPNKSAYFLRDGTFVPAGSKCVKKRRTNPLNPKAASRAMSRLKSAKNAASMLSRVTIRKKSC